MYFDEDFEEFVSPRFDTKHTHGTGCTFSAVITAELAKRQHTGISGNWKGIHFSTIKHPLGMGKGQGPTNHFAYRSTINQETTA
nr:bifunctional hydroxymethylpyrimidine kinase/phosphomethylpyrimidine kinase [Bacillus velezensis]